MRRSGLDAVTATVLREHRKRQLAELQMGSGWADHGFVFCRVDGTMLHPERLFESFEDRRRQLGLPKIRLHDLRHGWATMALAAGVPPKVVQERLGTPTSASPWTRTATSQLVCTDDAAERVAGLVFGDR